MSKVKFFVVVLATVLAAVAPSRLFAEEGSVPELFGAPANPMLDARSGSISTMERFVERSEIVVLSRSALQAERATISLDGVAYSATRVSFEQRRDEEFTGSVARWSIEGAAPSVITMKNGMVTGTFFAAGRQFWLAPGVIGQAQQVVKIALAGGLRDDVVVPPIRTIQPREEGVVNRVIGSKYEATVMGVYDPSGAQWMGGSAAAELLIQNKIDCTNSNLINSGYMDGHFRLVHVQPWHHLTTGVAATDLGDLSTDPTVAAARDQYRADLVVGFGGPGSGSSAYLANAMSPLSRDNGFAVISFVNAIANSGCEHEMGHLLLCQHDRAHATWPADRAMFSTAFGHIGEGSCPSDVMAYVGAQGQYYSAPVGTFDGCSMGSINEDNLKAIRYAFAIVSQYYPDSCMQSATALCLQNAGGQSPRFQLAVSWATNLGTNGSGQAVSLTADTGLFWFFNAANVEMTVKVLDGRGVNGKFWVFAAGLTDTEVFLSVTDTVTGQLRTYHNPMGTPFQPIQDTSAF